MAKDKPKKEKKSADAPANSLAGTPGVSSAIARTRSRWAIGGMALSALVAWGAGCSWWWVIAWAIIGGVAAMLVGWWVSVILWRTALSAEFAGRSREQLEAYQSEAEE